MPAQRIAFRSFGLNGAAAAILLFLAARTVVPAQAADCGQSTPWGLPKVTDRHGIAVVCHEGYVAGLDRVTREPRWVAYELTADHDLGCLPRTGLSFKVDVLAAPSEQGNPKDYAKSGYDLGHMAPNEDFAWDADEQRDTFSMANVAPQAPGLNRQGWERLEEDVRAWALTRGDLQVYVGPIYGETPKTIGADKLSVPSAFYKIVVDRQTGEEVGFIMPNKSIKKGAAQPWRAAIETIEDRANISVPKPPEASESSIAWPADLAGWRAAHSTACKK